MIDNNKIFYLIRPERYILKAVLCLKNYFYRFFLRESWYNFQDFKNFNNSSNYTSPSVNVNIKKSQYAPGNQIFINKINLVFKLVDVNRLAIDCQQMCANMFLKILSSLPNLDMIKITSLPSNIDLIGSDENSEIYNLFVKNNKITKLSLRNRSEIECIYLIMNLFPGIQSFAIHIPCD
jgi:hypothetical protein